MSPGVCALRKESVGNLCLQRLTRRKALLMHQNNDLPVDVDFTATAEASELLPLESRLAFVQVGVWEVRRRWLAGETADLDRLLACLDEDIHSLRQAIVCADEDAQAVTSLS